ncbi:MAG: hypothetical protein LAO09_13165 [Acidobacteriia bacterium]|nr:hypothetical protein [Terriglobia bacterium]
MKLHSRLTEVLQCALLIGGITLFARFALAQAGVPVPEDSPVFNAFRQLDKQNGYRVHMDMKASDPRMAKMMAEGMGMGPIEKLVKGGVIQTSMHWKMPAMDMRGQVDDWEIKAVVKDGRGARIFNTPAKDRILKYDDQMIAMQEAMLERQATMAIAQALAQGPMGAISAGLAASQVAQGLVMAAGARKQARDFFAWKCMEGAGGGQSAEKRANLLTDLKNLGDETVNGTSTSAYEFYARDGDKLRGPVRFYVAKDTGLPLRLAMTDPEGHGSINMDYDYSSVPDIEVPNCLK